MSNYLEVILNQSETLVWVIGVVGVEHDGKRWVREHEEEKKDRYRNSKL